MCSIHVNKIGMKFKKYLPTMTIADTIETKEVIRWNIPYVENKFKTVYSEVFTPYTLTDSLLSMLPDSIWKSKTNRFFDVGCGPGYMTYVLYKYLFTHIIFEKEENVSKRDYITSHMLYGTDVNNERLQLFATSFPINPRHLYHMDITKDNTCHLYNTFDVVICNPPYIIHDDNNKKQTLWPHFVKMCMQYAVDDGYVCLIIPSIWMKPIHPMYRYFVQYRIHKLKCITNNRANEWFQGDARTPLSYMCIQKRSVATMNDHEINIFDQIERTYIRLDPFSWNSCLPMYAPKLISKLFLLVQRFGALSDTIEKTNCPPKSAQLSTRQSQEHPYPNIMTCKIENKIPVIQINYSNQPLKYSGMRKVVLANKMYGFPHYDSEGVYGISSRDNYVLCPETSEECEKICAYLKLKIIYVIYESARYRMGYLEKYAFEWIPNILNMSVNMSEINDVNMSSIFQLTRVERDFIDAFYNKMRISRA